MPRYSAGLLLYRRRGGEAHVLLVHHGGPYWEGRDLGAWSVPKWEYDPDREDALAAALREFREETGFAPPDGEFARLRDVRQPGGKVVSAWMVEGDCDAAAARSNTFRMEWPRGSGRWQTFPEVDRAEWFDLATAREKILRGQVPLLDELEGVMEKGPGARP